MRVAVVGAGTAGLTTALLLARDGHDVSVVERVADPRPIGAGILLQTLGQRILATLGLADELAACSTPVRKIDGRTLRGAAVLRSAIPMPRRRRWGSASTAATCSGVLWDAARNAASRSRRASASRAVAHARDGWYLSRDAGERIGSVRPRRWRGRPSFRPPSIAQPARRDVEYPYGVVWAVVPDPEGLAGDTLWQRYGGTRITLGILPTGLGQTSIFWSERIRDLDAVVAAGPAAWLERALPYAGHLGQLVERVTDTGLLAARYRDVVVRRPVVVAGPHGAVLVGQTRRTR